METQGYETHTELPEINPICQNEEQMKGYEKNRCSLSTDIVESVNGEQNQELEKFYDLEIPQHQQQYYMYPQVQGINGGYSYNQRNSYQSYSSYNTQWQQNNQFYEDYQYYPQVEGNLAYQPYQFCSHIQQSENNCHNYQNHQAQYYPNRSEFRGRGRHSGFIQRGGKWRNNLKYVEKDENKHNQMHTSDSQQSQSEDQILNIEKQMMKMSLRPDEEKTIQFQYYLDPFFNRYEVSYRQKSKVLEYVTKNYSNLQEVGQLISTLYELESVSQEYFSQQILSLLSVVKQIVKSKYNIQEIKMKLNKKIGFREKKQYHDKKFREKFPNVVNIDFLELEDLGQLDKSKTLFLVDGNNIMPKQKKFRLYFESFEEKKKAEGQIRLSWLFSEAVQSEIFFDNKYKDQFYKKAKLQIFSKEEQKFVNKVPIHYAQKQQNPNNTADMKIVKRLAQIIESGQYKDYEIVLVSADNELAQLCSALFPIKKTSGKYIFKYCKKVIKQKYFHRPEMKGLMKRIFTF